MKKRKLNWGKFGLFILMIGMVVVIIGDFYKLTIKPFFTGELTGYSMFGLITLVGLLIAIVNIYDYLVGEE
ncbi:MAG TPA: hypothetical protein IAC14_08795 [Candidatus Scybalomonas excrementigallinarum]|nr:hypothetical protein [Candidatus Scybalomonas excrementigallinarum]